MQQTKNVMRKYLHRNYLWSRLSLGKRYRISEWRNGGEVIKLYEKHTELSWMPIHRVCYEISD